MRLTFPLLFIICSLNAAAQEVFWASELIQFSSEYESKSFSAKQVLGKPNALPQYGKNMVAWAPAKNTKNAFVTVGFEKAIQVQQIAVGENLRGGSISKITLFDEKGKEYVVFEKANPIPLMPDNARMFRHFIPLTSYKVKKLKLELNYSAFRDIPQIDCIGISSDKTPVEAKINTLVFKVPPGQAENLGPQINSPYDDMLPIISPDGKTLYFAKKKAPENFGAEKRDDIYISEKTPTGQWSKATNIGIPLNTDDHNFVCAVSPDGNTMYLANRYDYRTEGDGVAVAYKKKDNTWTKPKPLEIKNMYNNSPFACYHVSIYGKTMVMAIERENSFGDMDLYVSFKYADGVWSEPMNMGADVNTAGAEASVFLAADGKTIYFSSNGHSGYGDFDMFMSKRLDNTWRNWTEPVNLGSKINSPGRDIYYTIPASGDYAYYSSDVYGYGRNDLFRILLPQELRPDAVNLSAGLYPSSVQEEEIPLLKPYQEAQPSDVDSRIELLKQQLLLAQKGQQATSPIPVTPVTSNPKADPVNELDQQTSKIDQELSDLKNRYQTLQGSPQSSNQFTVQNTPGDNNTFNATEPSYYSKPAVPPYDASYDQKINEYKRQLELIKLKTSTENPIAKPNVPASNTSSNPALIAYEEKLRKLEEQQSKGATTSTVPAKPSGSTSAPKPDQSGNKALSVYEEKLRKMEEARKKQADETPTSQVPIRLEANKPLTTVDTLSDILVVENIPEDIVIPVHIDKQEINLNEDITEDPIKTDIELSEQKAALEKEIERLTQEKAKLSEKNVQEFQQVDAIEAKTKQLMTEKDSIALSIAQLQEEREQLTLEKQRLEMERQKLELLKSQQYRDINSLKRELDSLMKIQQQVKASTPTTNYSSAIDELESSTPEVGKKLSLKNVYFVANASFLQSKSYEELDRLALYLIKNKGLKMEVGGHTNGLCDDAFCNELSTRRAKSVVDYLITKGISPDRLSFKGYGKTQNITDNNSEEGRKLNQRVEIKITEIGN